MQIPFLPDWVITRKRDIPNVIVHQDVVPRTQYDELQKDRDRLYVEGLKLRANTQQRIDIIDPSIEDPTPVNEDERRVYVTRYSELHTSFLQKKLFHLIGAVREALDTTKMAEDFPLFTSRSEYDSYLRGTSNAFKLLLDYGEQMVNENAEYITRAKINP